MKIYYIYQGTKLLPMMLYISFDKSISYYNHFSKLNTHKYMTLIPTFGISKGLHFALKCTNCLPFI